MNCEARHSNMDFSRIEQSVTNHVDELLNWSEAPESLVQNYIDHPLWEEELWLETPFDIADVLGKIRKRIDRVGQAKMSGKYMSFVPSCGNYASCLAEIIRSQYDLKNSEIGREIETVVIKWMCSELGLSPKAGGYMTSGGSSSSVIAVAAAREAMGVQAYRSDRLVVYMTPMTHTCIEKALLVAGVGGVQVRLVELDALYRMDVKDLEKKLLLDKKAGLEPFMVVATIGTTDCGSIDPVEEIAKVTTSQGLWLHLDAAFGSMLALCPEIKEKVRGFGLCDSIIIDGHKALSQPFGSGTVLFNDVKHTSCFTKTAAGDNALWSSPLEDDAMPRGFQIWFSLSVFGARTFRDATRKNLQLAQYAAAQLADCAGVVVLPVASFIVTFRCDCITREESNIKTAAWYSAIEMDRRFILSCTSVEEYKFIRISFTNFRTHLSEVQFCLGIAIEKLKAVIGQAETPKPSTNLTWLHQFEKLTKDTERRIRLNYTCGLLKDLHLNLFNHAEKPRVQDRQPHSGMNEASRLLWPKEEARSVDEIMRIFADMPFADVSRPEWRYAGTLGHFLSSVGNTFSGKRLVAPGAVELEQKILQHLALRSGMPKVSGGVLSSDICTANILALLIARAEKLNAKTDPRRPVVYVSEQRQARFFKPLQILGLSKCVFRSVDSNTSGSINVESLTKTVEKDRKDPEILPWVICEVKGADEVDNPNVSTICQKFGLWYHVEVPEIDQGRLWSCDRNAPLKGLSEVDSLAIEIGKPLCLPVGLAAIVTSDHRKLRSALTAARESPYLVDHDKYKHTYEPSSYSFELSRPCRVLPLWFSLNLLGTGSLQ